MIFLFPFLLPIPSMYNPLAHFQIMASFSLVGIVKFLCVHKYVNTTCRIPGSVALTIGLSHPFPEPYVQKLCCRSIHPHWTLEDQLFSPF